MSGLAANYGMPGFGPGYPGQVSQSDIDQYYYVNIDNPSVDFAFLGTVSSATANAAFVLKNQLLDHPRNLAYSVTGVAGGMGGTFVANGINQFGVAFQESVTIGSAAGGGTAYGTQIAAKFLSGSFSPIGLGGTAVGTAAIGVGTAAGASGNYFGLLTRIGGTSDIKNITWVNNGTATGLNKGTSIGSLVNTGAHAFQGTSGVAITDTYRVMVKSTADNTSLGTTSGL